MAKECDICGKKPLSGNNVSHSNRRTKRRWIPNLHTTTIEENGKQKKAKICTTCLRTLAKKQAA